MTLTVSGRKADSVILQHRVQAIVERSTPLWMRSASTRGKGIDDSVSDRLARWQMVIGNDHGLRRRLINSGLADDPEHYLSRRGDIDTVANNWITIFTRVISATKSARSPHGLLPTDPVFDEANPVPFEELLVGFMRVARFELEDKGDRALNVLAPTARMDFERQLLRHLAYTGSFAFGKEWYLYRFKNAPGSSLRKIWGEQACSLELYRSFIRSRCSDGLLSFFEVYPVLARLMTGSVINWTNFVVEFCQRFEADWPFIQRELTTYEQSATPIISAVRPDQSDRHFGGRTVIICRLGNENQIVYKPRPIKAEWAFYRLVQRVNEFGGSIKLRGLSMVGAQTHGWTSHINSRDCTSEEEAHRYYYRSGMLLCLLHSLAVSDIHYENLISDGEHPVVVDLETLLDVPLSNAVGGDPSISLKSVLDTGMLPRLTPSNTGLQDSDDTDQDLSALGARSVDVTGISRPVWAHVNTDQMMLIDTNDKATPDPTPIRICGEPVVGSDYIVDVQLGFREMYGMLTRSTGQILDDVELLRLLNVVVPRVLIRNTSTYSRLQHHLLHPEFLQDGRDRTIELEWLARPLSAASLADNRVHDIYTVELSAMEELDIPYFNAHSVSNGDIASDQSEFAELFLRRRDAAAFIAILGKLDQENLYKQLELIKEAMAVRFAADDGGKLG